MVNPRPRYKFVAWIIAFSAAVVLHVNVHAQTHCRYESSCRYQSGHNELGCDAAPQYESQCCNMRHCQNQSFGSFHVYGEFINWWASDMGAPSLVTTSSAGTDRIDAGVMGLASTSTLFGDDVVSSSSQGGRFGTEWRLDNRSGWSINAEYLFLGENNDRFSGSNAILARPFFNVQTNQQASNLIAFPNIATGSIEASAGTKLSAWDVLAIRDIARNACYDSQVMFGYRGSRLDEFIHVNDSSTSLDAASGAAEGTRIRSTDRFDVDNTFNGFTIGNRLRAVLTDRMSLQLITKLSIGSVESNAYIGGQTTTTPAGQTSVTSSGGLLALPSNIGSYNVKNFAMLPELSLNAIYQMNPCWELRLGYTLHYWSQALRPGTVIDQNVNPSQLPPGVISGAAFPQERLTLTDFLAQGINVGLVGRF
ncbi:hypothetical protein CA51_13330 [Rosistilla oblonga]|nr:hypothetical protein CA51_13330 [Rosistilla oblonga]